MIGWIHSDLHNLELNSLTSIRRLSYAIAMGEGKALEPEVIAATIINGLPKSFDGWVISKAGQKKLDPDDLSKELQIIAQRTEQREKNMEEESEQGFNSRGKPTQGHPSKKPFYPTSQPTPRKETRECYFCKKIGHLAKDCRKKKASQKANNTKESKEEYFTFIMGEESESCNDTNPGLSIVVLQAT